MRFENENKQNDPSLHRVRLAYSWNVHFPFFGTRTTEGKIWFFDLRAVSAMRYNHVSEPFRGDIGLNSHNVLPGISF